MNLFINKTIEIQAILFELEQNSQMLLFHELQISKKTNLATKIENLPDINLKHLFAETNTESVLNDTLLENST